MSSKRRINYRDEGSSSEEEINDNDPRFNSSYEPQSVWKNEITSRPQEISRKRGRGPSKRPCLNRNAAMARENRQRKKEYVQDIENKLLFYQQESKSLSNIIQKQENDIKRLNAEVSYLRSVLNNSGRITALLQAMNDSLQKLWPKVQTNSASIKQVAQNEAKPKEYPTQKLTAVHNLKKTDNVPCPVQNLQNFPLKQEKVEISTDDKRHDLAQTQRVRGMQTGEVGTETEHPFNELDHICTFTDESQIFGNDQSSNFNNLDEGIETLLPITPVSLDEKTDCVPDDVEFNQLPSFNSSIFDNLAQLDETSITVDFVEDESNLFTRSTDDSLFQSLDNDSGICLHVNPTKVSLEFCSACQMNSRSYKLD